MAAFFADLDEPDLVSYGRRSGIFHPSIQIDPDVQAEIDKLDRQIEALKSDENASRDAIRNLERQKERVSMGGYWSLISKQRETPRMMRILPRGNFLDETGEIVEPAIPEFLGTLSIGDENNSRASRLDLAHWLTAPENPLTSRVTVNRLWYLFFGNGLSNVLDDLGYQGEWPSHPELLDFLAVEFAESGWDIKHMVRLLVSSQAYRQSSRESSLHREVDPQNRLYARQSRFRLQAEFIRDTALYTSGLLNQSVGGRSAKPYQPDGYWADSYKSVGNPHVYHRDSGPALYRRGLYTFWKRTFLHPEMLTFDAPNREECVARRPISNTPLQALVLLNDPTFVESARVLAQNVLLEVSENPDSDKNLILSKIFQRVLQRDPISAESTILLDLYQKHLADFSANTDMASDFLATGDFPVSDSLPLPELAAWSSVCRTVLNLHETLTRP